MTPIRKIIYLIIFIVFILTIVFCLIKLTASSSATSQTNSPINNTVQDIDWATATNLIKNCQIKVIFQARTLQINMRGHDNQLYYTLEPKFNDVINLAQKVQGPCDIIQTVTE